MGKLKTFSQFLESTSKEIVITFGQFQPPTVAHGKLLDKVFREANNSPYRIYQSQKQNPQTDPLNHTEKVKLMRLIFPRHARNIIEDSSVDSILDAAIKVYKDGFSRLIFVTGSDKVLQVSKLLQKNNGVNFDFPDGIEVVSNGEADPDSNSIEALKMIQDGNFQGFIKAIPPGHEDAVVTFNLFRKRMGLKEITNFREHVQLAPVSNIREKFVRGETLLIGDSAKVISTGETVKIIERGPNFIVTESTNKTTKKRWLKDVEPLNECQEHNQWLKELEKLS